MSVGSCYDSSTHVVTCNVEDDDCSGSWYAPGYVSGYSGCCHCQASCGNVTADCADSYYDDPCPTPAPTPEPTNECGVSAGSCYDSSTHVVSCDVADEDCSGYENRRASKKESRRETPPSLRLRPIPPKVLVRARLRLGLFQLLPLPGLVRERDGRLRRQLLRRSMPDARADA